MVTSDRVDALTDAALHLIETEGLEALTLRRLAAVMRLSPSTLTSHLTSKHRMIDLITKRTGQRLLTSIEVRLSRVGLAAFVPDEDQLTLVRGWLALSELARTDEETGLAVVDLESELRHTLGWAGAVPARDELTRIALHGLTTGLWRAMCAPAEALSEHQARDVLRHACAALGVTVPDPV